MKRREPRFGGRSIVSMLRGCETKLGSRLAEGNNCRNYPNGSDDVRGTNCKTSVYISAVSGLR
jgi:hypothetical protein